MEINDSSLGSDPYGSLQDHEPRSAIVLMPSGKLVDVFDIRDDDVTIRDAAISLSNQCRYNGNCNKFYSVAEHSLHTCEIMMAVYDRLYEQLPGTLDSITENLLLSYPRGAWGLAGLCHDFGEVLIGDMVHPLKKYFTEFQELDIYVSRRLSDALDFPVIEPYVPAVDESLAQVELEALTNIPKHEISPQSVGSSMTLEITYETLLRNMSDSRRGLSDLLVSGNSPEEVAQRLENKYHELKEAISGG